MFNFELNKRTFSVLKDLICQQRQNRRRGRQTASQSNCISSQKGLGSCLSAIVTHVYLVDAAAATDTDSKLPVHYGSTSAAAAAITTTARRANVEAF